MNAKKLITFQVARRFEASAEQVFDAFLDPAKASKFMFATPTGEMVRAEVDARVGGKFVFTNRREGMDWVHTGAYLEIDRPHRLVFTLTVEHFGIPPQRVIIDIVPKGTGCELTLTQELTPDLEEWVDQSKEGWTAILEKLAAELG